MAATTTTSTAAATANSVLQSGQSSLAELAEKTVFKLQEIWQQIGLSEDEVNNEVEDLLTKVALVYEITLQEAETRRDTYTSNLTTFAEEIGSWQRKLGGEDLSPQVSPTYEKSSLIDKVMALEQQLNLLKQTGEERAQTLKTLQRKILEEKELLGEDLEPEFRDITSDYSKKRIMDFEVKLNCLTIEKSNRKNAIEKLRCECADILSQLKYETLSDFDELILKKNESIGFSIDVIEELSKRGAELVIEKNERESVLKEIGEKISTLWDKLKVSQSVQESFFEGVSGIGLDAIDSCKFELQRLNSLKQERMVDLIKEDRDLIVDLWNQMEFSEDARTYFISEMAIPVENMNEQVLQKHDEELVSLRHRFDAMKPLLKYVERREAIIEERAEYEESFKNPDRLLGRNGKRDTGRLLREEKLQTRIKKDLPKITALLLKKIKQWEEENGTSFLYKGTRYLDYMIKFDEDYTQTKDNEKAEKDRLKKEKLAHEITWGSTPVKGKKALKSRKSIATPSKLSRQQPLSKDIGNICSLNREEETKRRKSTLSTTTTVSSSSSNSLNAEAL